MLQASFFYLYTSNFKKALAVVYYLLSSCENGTLCTLLLESRLL